MKKIAMKTVENKDSLRNHPIFKYDGKTYDYVDIFRLIIELPYNKSGKDCDWFLFKVHDLTTDKDALCLSFQETMSDEDMSNNLNFFPKFSNAVIDGKVEMLKYHGGFYSEYASAKNEILNELRFSMNSLAEEQNISPSKVKVFVIGWSLGASLAVIASLDIHYLFGIKPTMIAYEAPNPCLDKRTKELTLRSINLDESVSFIHGTDIVAYLPPNGKHLDKIECHIDDGKIKPPFRILKRLWSFLTKTEWYHVNVDDGIINYL